MSARKVTWNGKSLTITEWAKEAGMLRNTLYQRLRLGMSFEEAITTPVHYPAEYTFNGTTQTLQEWSNELGIAVATLRNRLRAGYSIERAFTQEVHWGAIRQLALATALNEAPGVGQDFAQGAGDRPMQHRDTLDLNRNSHRIFEEFSDE